MQQLGKRNGIHAYTWQAPTQPGRWKQASLTFEALYRSASLAITTICYRDNLEKCHRTQLAVVNRGSNT
jgi:hypothetical protein